MESLPHISQMPETTVNGAVAIAIAVGTLYCFLGYKTLKLVIGLTGFMLAGAVAGALGAWLAPGNTPVLAGAALVGGFCGAMALFFLYRVGVFLLGLLASALVAHAIFGGSGETWELWAVLGSAVAGGLLALVLERGLMIMATAALGAWIVVCGVGFFLVGPAFLDIVQQPVELGRDRRALVLSWGILALSGALAQFVTNRGKPREVVVTRA